MAPGGNGVGEQGALVAGDDFVSKFGISPREREIIDLICTGKTNREIGEALFISHQTVKDHIYKIFRKTGAKNRISLANLVRG